ncbi:hypothetical protein PF005_g12168 [Phytophthora fragariae]|uniref:Uncharacterized protein n=2 Tax=Phytophthora fragariae TaxID=53985 RepID=A0A6A3XUF9_9STRA|nr:hypothetical protein PF005_g12168 [Phytophthora fragariae]
MNSETRKRLIQDAMARKAFPPVIDLPENRRQWEKICPLGDLFDNPVIVWVPECLNAHQKPDCVVDHCTCTPLVKEYLQRVVENVEGKYNLLYVKYQCAGSSRSCFSSASKVGTRSLCLSSSTMA